MPYIGSKGLEGTSDAERDRAVIDMMNESYLTGIRDTLRALGRELDHYAPGKDEADRSIPIEELKDALGWFYGSVDEELDELRVGSFPFVWLVSGFRRNSKPKEGDKKE